MRQNGKTAETLRQLTRAMAAGEHVHVVASIPVDGSTPAPTDRIPIYCSAPELHRSENDRAVIRPIQEWIDSTRVKTDALLGI